jgi:hypothetical protein
MKKFKILLSLIAITILLASGCSMYDEKYGDDWFASESK